MSVNSILANFFSNLKNHSLAKKKILKQKNTKQILKIVKLLTYEGFLYGYSLDSSKKFITIFLKYQNQKSVINKIKFISKPGKPFYVNNKWSFKKNNKEVLHIISTQKGFVTKIKAQELNLGGTLICEIY